MISTAGQRAYHRISYDSFRNQYIMFSGYDSDNIDDMWLFSTGVDPISTTTETSAEITSTITTESATSETTETKGTESSINTQSVNSKTSEQSTTWGETTEMSSTSDESTNPNESTDPITGSDTSTNPLPGMLHTITFMGLISIVSIRKLKLKSY